MADSFTSNYSFTQPEVTASVDTWGNKLNNNWGVADSILRLFVGIIKPMPADSAVPGWLKCNGQEVSRTTYSRLWDFASTKGSLAASEGAKLAGQFGPGDGATTFTLPDLRGRFLRSLDDGAGVDPGRTVGSLQSGQNLSHDHTDSSAGGHTHSTGSVTDHDHGGATGSSGSHSHSGSIGAAGSHTHTYTREVGGEISGISNVDNDAHERWVDAATSTAGAHSHTVSVGASGTHSHTINTVGDHTHTISSDGTHIHTLNATGATDFRPTNVALTFYIRY